MGNISTCSDKGIEAVVFHGVCAIIDEKNRKRCCVFMPVSLESNLLQLLLQLEQSSSVKKSVTSSDQNGSTMSQFADLLATALLNGTNQQAADLSMAGTADSGSDLLTDQTSSLSGISSSPASSSDLLWQLLSSSLNQSAAAATTGTDSVTADPAAGQNSQPAVPSVF
jgi:hypothetical protein